MTMFRILMSTALVGALAGQATAEGGRPTVIWRGEDAGLRRGAPQGRPVGSWVVKAPLGRSSGGAIESAYTAPQTVSVLVSGLSWTC